MICIICVYFDSEFDRVAPNGEQAVAAIENYQNVLLTLSQAQDLATEANVSVAAANDVLQTIEVNDILQAAIQSETDSRLVNETVRARQNTPACKCEFIRKIATVTFAFLEKFVLY